MGGGGGLLPPAEEGRVVSRSKSRPVSLSPAERKLLVKLLRTGSHAAQEIRRARILLELDENHAKPATQEVIAKQVGVCIGTVANVARVYAEQGGDVEAAIRRKQRETPPVEPKLTGEVEARLIALACTKPPDGHTRWSLRLLEKHVLLTDGMPALDHSTIGRALRKHNFVLI